MCKYCGMKCVRWNKEKCNEWLKEHGENTILEGEYTNAHDSNLTFICGCGNKFNTRSTVKGDTIKVEVCNKCHPFFTGKQKLVDTAGRVEKFKKKYNID